MPSTYYVRWFAPGRARPMRRTFNTKGERDRFLNYLPYLYETGTEPKDGAIPPPTRQKITWGPP